MMCRVMEQTMASTTDNLIAAPTPQTDIDKMFSGIGNSGGALTIEDKQRIAQQQETARRLKQQPTIAPAAPTDLTSRLLHTNLNQLTTPKAFTMSQAPNKQQKIKYKETSQNELTKAPKKQGPNSQAYPPGLWNQAPADWSAFESLLPSQSQNNNQSSDNVKKLSNNEMMDLLS
ncbi:hypothetical protein ACJJTC_017344 [Scirpophaga incertulas]